MVARRMQVVALILFGIPAVGRAETPWKQFKSDEFGFEMMVPPKMAMKAAKLGDWGGFHGKLGVVDLYGVAKLGVEPTLEVMQAFAIEHTGIPARAWVRIHAAENERGWKWFKTYRAKVDKKFIYAILGHGPKGAYVLVLTTTPANRLLFDKAYKRWYGSVTVF